MIDWREALVAFKRLLTFLIAAGVILLAIKTVSAHDTGKGWSYPWSCCADHDCSEISADRVKEEGGGYVVDGRFHVQPADVKFSPDGHFHACFPNPETLRCFFAPPSGS